VIVLGSTDLLYCFWWDPRNDCGKWEEDVQVTSSGFLARGLGVHVALLAHV
jgi:hypothetical protein